MNCTEMAYRQHYCQFKQEFIQGPEGQCSYCDPYSGSLAPVHRYQSTSSEAYSSNPLDSTGTSSPHESLSNFSSFPDELHWGMDHATIPSIGHIAMTNGFAHAEHLHHFDAPHSSSNSSYQGRSRSQHSPHELDTGFGVEQQYPSPGYKSSHLAPPAVDQDQGDLKPAPAATSPQLNRVACLHCSNTFSRQADVDRHVDSVHNREQRQQHGNLLDCPHPNCHRKGSRGFGRKDHWLEHRRSFHHEHLPKRRSRSRSERRSGGSDDMTRRQS